MGEFFSLYIFGTTKLAGFFFFLNSGSGKTLPLPTVLTWCFTHHEEQSLPHPGPLASTDHFKQDSLGSWRWWCVTAHTHHVFLLSKKKMRYFRLVYLYNLSRVWAANQSTVLGKGQAFMQLPSKLVRGRNKRVAFASLGQS